MGNKIVVFLEYNNATLKIKISLQNTIKQLKTKINKKYGIKAASQTLFFKDKELLDSNSLSYYNINNNSKIKIIENYNKSANEKPKVVDEKQEVSEENPNEEKQNGKPNEEKSNEEKSNEEKSNEEKSNESNEKNDIEKEDNCSLFIAILEQQNINLDSKIKFSTIGELKQIIYEHIYIPVYRQKLFFNREEIINDKKKDRRYKRYKI